jgi:hypothetical protein
MGTRLRLLIIFIGALLVVATFTYPSWRPDPIPDTAGIVQAFPELPDDLQAAFSVLPATTQQGYLRMREQNPRMAADLVIARLTPDDPLPPEAQAPPNVEGAVVIKQGEFRPVVMPEDDERELPPFRDLYASSGTVIIYEFADESRILRIENLQVVNGPDLQVALTTLATPLVGGAAPPIDRDTVTITLAPLLAPSGSQNYVNVIPKENDIDSFNAVIIYDRTYNIVFAVAQIA